MLTLTIAEIKDLAEFAGLVLKENSLTDAAELEKAITITPCPESGVLDDDGKPGHFAHVAYFTDHPEEGCYPLGDEVGTIGRMILADLKDALERTHSAGADMPVLLSSVPADCQKKSREDAFEAGRAAALNAVESSPYVLGAMDEQGNSEAETAYAMGWNSIWASAANTGRLQSPPEVDLGGVLGQRVADGQPIYVTGAHQNEALDAITRIAKQAAADAGKSAKILQLVELQVDSESAVAPNPVSNFVAEPDDCLKTLMRGAGVLYLSEDVYEDAKRTGLEAAKDHPVSIKLLVDAWNAKPTLAGFAEAVEQAYLLR